MRGRISLIVLAPELANDSYNLLREIRRANKTAANEDAFFADLIHFENKQSAWAPVSWNNDTPVPKKKKAEYRSAL